MSPRKSLVANDEGLDVRIRTGWAIHVVDGDNIVHQSRDEEFHKLANMVLAGRDVF